jgi:choline transport protein
MLSAVIPVFVASKKISVICQITLLLSIVGVAMTLFVPTGMHEQVQPPSFLVSPSAGETGWGSGVSWMLGICNAMYAFGGTDGGEDLCTFLRASKGLIMAKIALHIAEEMQHPGRRVPQIIITTLMIGLATTLPLFIALLLFSNDTGEIMDSPLPSAELIHQA